MRGMMLKLFGGYYYKLSQHNINRYTSREKSPLVHDCSCGVPPPLGSGSWAASCVHVRLNKSNHNPPSSSPASQLLSLSLSLSQPLMSHSFPSFLILYGRGHMYLRPFAIKILLIIWKPLNQKIMSNILAIFLYNHK
jgi:hypothetical protein